MHFAPNSGEKWVQFSGKHPRSGGWLGKIGRNSGERVENAGGNTDKAVVADYRGCILFVKENFRAMGEFEFQVKF
jgi:hypothetical protein